MVIMSTFTSTQIPNQKTSKQKPTLAVNKTVNKLVVVKSYTKKLSSPTRFSQRQV